MVIAFKDDNRLEGTEILKVQITLDDTTQTGVNNSGNIFFQDTLNISVADITGTFEQYYNRVEKSISPFILLALSTGRFTPFLQVHFYDFSPVYVLFCSGVGTPRHTQAYTYVKFVDAKVKIMQTSKSRY